MTLKFISLYYYLGFCITLLQSFVCMFNKFCSTSFVLQVVSNNYCSQSLVANFAIDRSGRDRYTLPFHTIRSEMETEIPKSMIAGVQSVMPVEVTQHRKARSITVRDPVGVGLFRRTLNIVTYYKETGDSGERGWLAAGWIRESLGRALTEQPMLCGRLRRKTKAQDGLEVVTNDSGIRLLEAKFPASLSDFLEMVKRDKSRAEAETVFWKDIDEDEPQFSPLFYVQVTNFESGGYSIGISCSVLLADILLGTDFLTKWSQMQSSLAQSKTLLKPMFYLPSMKQDPGKFHIELCRSASVLDRGEPVVFRAKTCLNISPASIVTHEKVSGDVFLFVKEQGSDEISTKCDGMKVEIHSKDEATTNCDLEETDGRVLNKNLAFGERLEVTSCWVGSVSNGVVFVVPSTSGDAKSHPKFIVAVSKK